MSNNYVVIDSKPDFLSSEQPPEMQDFPLSHLKDGDYSRDNLIAICEAAVVDVDKWWDRDSPHAHEKLGLCWVMLKAGCRFWIHREAKDGESGCYTNSRTIWLGI